MAEEQSNISRQVNSAQTGLNMDQSVSQVPKGKLTYALNASVENYDANSVNYQNEPGNELCLNFPEGFLLIGKHLINEQNKHIFFLVNPDTGESEIGYMDNNDCIYHKYINASCLNFDKNFPIHKVVHKITNCSTEIYWPDKNGRRFLDLNTPPYKVKPGTDVCDNETVPEMDCNKLKVQPNFNIPSLRVSDIISGGSLTAGTVQFAIQYCDVLGGPYTSYYSVTNPTPIANLQITTADFNYPVGKAVVLDIDNIDVTGFFQYFNIAVIKTVNNITSVELVGTYFIDSSSKQIIYSGQNQTQIRLTINDIFEKFPYYDIADDVTAVQDIIVWKGLTSVENINYQQIANKIKLQWETYRIPQTENYADELNATNLKSFLRDEVYPFEICYLLTNGKQTDGFHIPGRALSPYEQSLPDIDATDPDFIGEPDPSTGKSPYWKIYNTASVTETDVNYSPYSDYKGPYQVGEFAYWESTELYPCNTDVWGDLSNTPIRHHKFPDVLVSPIFETQLFTDEASMVMQKDAIFPIGVKVNAQQIESLIAASNLTQEQKDAIVGFKILRGNRSVNKSIVAKGILRNVGKYTREGTEYYFPNYPYNDLRVDPFLLTDSNAYNAECNTYSLQATVDTEYQYTDCLTNTQKVEPLLAGNTAQVCSLTTPTFTEPADGTVDEIGFDTYIIDTTTHAVIKYVDYSSLLPKIMSLAAADSPLTLQVQVGTKPTVTSIFGKDNTTVSQVNQFKNETCYPSRLKAFETNDSKYRYVFNSPETSFGQPFLGDILKLENVIFGRGKAHFTEVNKNALYKLITKEAQEDALNSSSRIANITGTYNSTALFTAYQAYLQIYTNGITRKNYGYSYNSIASYDYSSAIQNGLGVKQRKLDYSQYIIPGVQSVGEDIVLNAYQRESSVFLRTDESLTPLPFASQTPSLLDNAGNSLVEDKSRFINSQKNCSAPEELFDISAVSYYGSIKNIFNNQWGQMYSYETIDTGAQFLFNDEAYIAGTSPYLSVFGGDTFINQFSFKTKLPFFIDNRVGAPDDSDIFYDEIGNVAYPEYWHSARSILFDYKGAAPNPVTPVFSNIISIKAHYLDCPNNQLPAPDTTVVPAIVNPNRSYYDGKMYMFAYGIPTFYCESSVNVDLRQAFNNREGDFYPHVSTGIPDDWLQESFVPIAQDNTYYYNVSYSKQNKENFFTHLPVDWEEKLCYTNFPFRAIFSDPQQSFNDNRVNSWLLYRAASYFDFPQNYGNFTSIDGIDNRQVLARFDNKSFLYNALYTTQTNVQGQVYLGQSIFSSQVPPLDFAETDLGFVGSQHKFLLKIPQGQVSVDAKRGQVFLMAKDGLKDLSAFGSGLNRFFTDHLAFEILRYFPAVNIDNHYNGVGLHGVYDSKYDRIIISKLDYIPVNNSILYDTIEKRFYIEEAPTGLTIKRYVELTDLNYFCNKSWTLSFNLNTMSWVSFHSYIPNFYIAENNFFYSGLNESCDLEAIAVQEVAPTTTTTTTSAAASCELSGNVREIYCTLEGTVVNAAGSTTTSTTSTTSTTTTSTSTTTSTTTLAPVLMTVYVATQSVLVPSDTVEVSYSLDGGGSWVDTGDVTVSSDPNSPDLVLNFYVPYGTNLSLALTSPSYGNIVFFGNEFLNPVTPNCGKTGPYHVGVVTTNKTFYLTAEVSEGFLVYCATS